MRIIFGFLLLGFFVWLIDGSFNLINILFGCLIWGVIVNEGYKWHQRRNKEKNV